MYEARKKRRNALIGHCYGALHTLHLMKWLRDEGRAEEVVGVAMMSLGSRAPVSVGLLGKLPAFILGLLQLETFLTRVEKFEKVTRCPLESALCFDKAYI